MSMVFPTDILPSFDIEIIEHNNFKTYKTITGKEYIRYRRLRPKREVILRYNYRYDYEVEKLWQFYMDTQGLYNSFVFIFPHEENWENEFISIIWQEGFLRYETELPFADYTSVTIYHNNNIVPSDNYTIIKNTNKRSILKFNWIVSKGILKCDFVGKPTLNMRFADNLTRTIFENMLNTIGIRLIETT